MAKGGDPTTDNYIAHTLRADGFNAGEDGTGRGTPLVPIAFAHQQGGSVDLHTGDNIALALQRSQTQAVAIQERAVCENPNAGPDGAGFREGIAYTLEARTVPQAVALGVDSYNGLLTGDVAATLGTQSGDGVSSGPSLLSGMAVRRITPREAERLQGFPDGWTDVPYRGKPAADGPRYKALGNSMAVPCMAWIGERIAMVEALTQESEAVA